MKEHLTIYQAMAAILADIDFIGKDRSADMGNAGKYKFRGIDDIYNALHKSFAKYGVFIIPKILESNLEIQEKEKTYNGVTTKTYSQSAKLTVEFTFASADGSSLSAVGFGYALDSSDKAATKAQSAALKYCLMQTFLIPTEESKDVENDDIEQLPPRTVVAPAKVAYTAPPPAAIAKPSQKVLETQKALTECIEILGWSKEQKVAWVKTISPKPCDLWSLQDWELAIVKAHMEIDQMNSQGII
jgi:hypothetical protein